MTELTDSVLLTSYYQEDQFSFEPAWDTWEPSVWFFYRSHSTSTFTDEFAVWDCVD